MMIMVVVSDYSSLLALFPVPHQQHGGVLMGVLEKFENENYEEK